MNLKYIISFIFILSSFVFSQLEYSLEDVNTTSPSFGNNVSSPYYSNYISLHFFSSQG